MIKVKIKKNGETKESIFYRNEKKIFYYIFSFIFIIILILLINFCLRNKILIGNNLTNNKKFLESHENNINKINYENSNQNNKCYIPIYYPNIKILHLIITRFLLEIPGKIEFHKIIKTKEYILNGIRVMKKYLLKSLQKQSSKCFNWVLLIGNTANATLIKSLINLNKLSFKATILYEKEIKQYIIDKTKNYDILITTRIDYDDQIYYDAVNDVRKQVNINKPMLLYGYNMGFYYFESEDKYFINYSNNKEGAWGLFLSLIIVLNKVNDTYSIYDLGNHFFIRQTLLKNYKSYGIKDLNYEPAIFDSGDPKFIYVRQNYSHSYDDYKSLLEKNKYEKIKLNLTTFYGK